MDRFGYLAKLQETVHFTTMRIVTLPLILIVNGKIVLFLKCDLVRQSCLERYGVILTVIFKSGRISMTLLALDRNALFIVQLKSIK